MTITSWLLLATISNQLPYCCSHSQDDHYISLQELSPATLLTIITIIEHEKECHIGNHYQIGTTLTTDSSLSARVLHYMPKG